MASKSIPQIEWKKLYQVLNDYADYFIAKARENLSKNHSVASGELYNSFKKIISIADEHYSVSIELASYWDYVEKGRKAGKFPPPNKIAEWIRVKPIKPYPNARGKLPSVSQLTYLIGRKIAREGTKAQPFFAPALADANEHFKLMIELAIDEDVSNYIEQVIEQQIMYEELFKML